MLNAEDGPWQVCVRLRRMAGDGFWGELLDCFYCLSLWISAPLAVLIGQSVREDLLLWLGISTGAIFLERIMTNLRGAEESPYFTEAPEIENVLWEQSKSDDGDRDA